MPHQTHARLHLWPASEHHWEDKLARSVGPVDCVSLSHRKQCAYVRQLLVLDDRFVRLASERQTLDNIPSRCRLTGLMALVLDINLCVDD